MKTFYDALGTVIPATEIASKGGLSYLSAGTAMKLAGRPEVTFVDFDGQPFLECLTGALVAVDLPIPATDLMQRMYLPVMDRDNNAMKLSAVTVEDINSNRQRALVKAIATVFGDGMSLYLGHDGSGDKAVKRLGVEPTTDLAEVPPVVAKLEEGGEPYIEWSVGVAVCRITDPTFHWKVLEWNGKPYREVLGGLMVDVLTVYKGKRQVLSLPILDGAFVPIPAAKATTFDWNKTVVRALTKCIAFNTGYGLSVYADVVGDAKKEARKPSSKANASSTSAPKAQAAAPAKTEETASATPAQATTQATTQAAAQAQAGKPSQEKATQATAPAEAPGGEQPANAVASSVARFKEVMQNRKSQGGVAGLMTLFEALKVSTKFAEEHKPACYAALVNALAGLAEGQDCVDLVDSLRTYGAMAHVSADAKDLVAGRIAKSCLAAALADGDDVLRAVPATLVSAGVVKDLDDLVRVAKLADTPAETVDLLMALAETA